MRKYELTEETKTLADGTVLHRICALRDIPRHGVKAGELGGFVEGENNLSQDGNAWVYVDARVRDNAQVRGDARVSGDAWVFGNARISGNARVRDNALVYGDAWVSGNAEVFGNALVSGNALVYGDAKVYDNADYMTFKNSWSSGMWFTYTRSNKKWVAGCFYGTGEELIKKAYADSELSGRCYEAIVRAVETIEAAKAEVEEEK